MINEKNEKNNNGQTVQKIVLEHKEPILKNNKEDDKMNDDKIPLTVAPEE